MISAVMAPPFNFGTQRAIGVSVKTGRLEDLDVGKPIEDPAADLEKSGALSLPSPLLKRAMGDCPTLSEGRLIKMLHF